MVQFLGGLNLSWERFEIHFKKMMICFRYEILAIVRKGVGQLNVILFRLYFQSQIYGHNLSTGNFSFAVCGILSFCINSVMTSQALSVFDSVVIKP